MIRGRFEPFREIRLHEQFLIEVHLLVPDLNGIPARGDDPFDQRLVMIAIDDDDIPVLRLIGQPGNDQAIVIDQRVLHGIPVHTHDTTEKGEDENHHDQ